MSYFKTKRHLERYLVILAVFVVPLFFLLEYPLSLKIIFLLPILLIPMFLITDLIIDYEKIIIQYPFLKIAKRNIIPWGYIKEIQINFRSGLTHGAMMPSYIEFEKKDQTSSKVYYKLSKEELKLLNSIAMSKGIRLIIKNNPYI